MKNSIMYKGYIGSVEYSAADDCLFGEICGINDIISYEGDSVEEIHNAFKEAVDDYLAHCKSIGKKPNKPYSKELVLHLEPDTYAKLSYKANKKNMKFEQYIGALLAE